MFQFHSLNLIAFFFIFQSLYDGCCWKVEIELFFVFFSHAFILVLLYMLLLLVMLGEWEKGATFAGFLGLIIKTRKLYMLLVMISLVSLRGWSDYCGELLVVSALSGLWEMRELLYFWARKGFCLWSYGGLE